MPKTTFNGWILNKILSLLKKHEGVTPYGSEYYSEGARGYIVDAFGYRYEIQVIAVGRLQNYENLEENPYYADTILQKSIKTQE